MCDDIVQKKVLASLESTQQHIYVHFVMCNTLCNEAMQAPSFERYCHTYKLFRCRRCSHNDHLKFNQNDDTFL